MPRQEDSSGWLNASDVRAADAGIAARMRDLHLEMIAAIIAGGGLERLAQLAGAEVGAPVAIVVPRLGEAGAPARAASSRDPSPRRRSPPGRAAQRPAAHPPMICAR